MLFWISVGLFATATSIGLITYSREKNTNLKSNPKNNSYNCSLKVNDQILFQNENWFIKNVASATDGVKELEIAELEPPPLYWIKLKDTKKSLINGFYKEKSNIGKDRVLAQHFFLNDSSYDFKMKTRMKCSRGKGLFEQGDSSIEIYIFEDKIQKNYLLQIKGSSINYIFEGDNYAADEMMVLSKS